MRCIHCNKQIPEDSIYCNHCGKQQVLKYDQFHQGRIRPFLRTRTNKDAYLLVHLIFFILLLLASFSTIGRVPLTHLVPEYPSQLELKFNMTDLVSAVPYVFEQGHAMTVKSEVDQVVSRVFGLQLGFLSMSYQDYEQIDPYYRQNIESAINKVNPLIIYSSESYRNDHVVPMILWIIATIAMLTYVFYLIYGSYWVIKALTETKAINIQGYFEKLVIVSFIVMFILRVFGIISGYELGNYSKNIFWLPFWGYVISLTYTWACSNKSFNRRYLARKVMILVLLVFSLNTVMDIRLDTRYQSEPLFHTYTITDREPILRFLPSFVNDSLNLETHDVLIDVTALQTLLNTHVDSRQSTQYVLQQVNSYDHFFSPYVIYHYSMLSNLMLVVVLLYILSLLMLGSLVIQYIQHLNQHDMRKMDPSELPGMLFFLSILMIAGLIYIKIQVDQMYLRLSLNVYTWISWTSFLYVISVGLLAKQEQIFEKLKL